VKRLSRDRLEQILSEMQGRSILIIGDVMLDRYITGSVNRISPEAPVPVVNVRSERIALGGAANVACNVKALGGNPLLIGVVGDDETASVFKQTAGGKGINCDFLITDSSRPTTLKTRVVAHNQQVVRIDQEQKLDVGPGIEKKIIAVLRKLMGRSDAVLLEDYNKGILTSPVIRECIQEAHQLGKTISVDPKTRKFFDYRGATLFKPNEKELLSAIGEISADRMEEKDFLQQVRRKIDCENLLITRGEKGMILVQKNGDPFSIPTVAREVFDVSGAGDTVISAATMALSVDATSRESAIIANYAAGVEVSRAGVAAIIPDEILASYDSFNGSVHR